MTKVQALQAYGAAVLTLHYALGEFFAGVDAELAGEPLDIEDHEIKIQVPLELRKLCDLGPEAYTGEVLESVARPPPFEGIVSPAGPGLFFV